MAPFQRGLTVQRLLALIQQRKLDRVAAAYGVTAWLIVQAASIALPAFGAPAWVLKVLIAGAIAGFPLALWIAWHVTISPYHSDEGTPRPSTKADIVLLVFLGLVILLTAAQLLFGGSSWSSATKPAPIAATRMPPNLPPKASIAVLPFTNMSGDAAKEYFSDGISEELLNQLANAPDLRVAARTSSFAFKGKNEDIRSIARALNVRAVLEGSVREEGQHIRITAQLINAADGYHIWSKTYDRDLSNILALQDEIARAITQSLTHSLLGGSTHHTAPTQAPIAPEVYRKYLEGRSLLALKTDDGDAKAVTLLKEVTQAQPAFAPAFEALGRTYIHMAEFHDGRADLVASAEAALRQALKLDPHNLEALSSHVLLSLMRWDWQQASKDAKALQSLNPHSVFTLRGLHYYYESLGFPEQDSATLREATRLDPLSFVDLNNLATSYLGRAEYAEAASAASDALALRPDRALALYTLCSANVGMKRQREAQILIGQLLALHQPEASRGCALKNAAASGRLAEAHALADGIAGRYPAFIFNETDIASFYLAAGDSAKAIAWFERAYDKRNQDLFATPYFAVTPGTLAKLPGWQAIMRRPEARAWQAARDRVAQELSAG